MIIRGDITIEVVVEVDDGGDCEEAMESLCEEAKQEVEDLSGITYDVVDAGVQGYKIRSKS